MNDLVTASIRTAVPYIIGGLGSFLATQGVDIPADVKTQLVGVLTWLLGTAYYILVVTLQKAYPENKIVKYLLGSPKTPTYK